MISALLDRSFQSRRGKRRAGNLDSIIGSDELAPMTIGTAFPPERDELEDEPATDFGPHREITRPDFSLPSEETNGPFDDALQIAYPEERAGAINSRWSIPAKVFGALRHLLSGQNRPPVPTVSVDPSNGTRIAGDHTPAPDDRPVPTLRGVTPVYRKRPEAKASDRAVQVYVAEHRDESVAEPTAATVIGATAVWPIGKLGQDIIRSIGRWQEKPPAARIAFLTRPIRERRTLDRTATADEQNAESAAPNEVPFPASSKESKEQANTSVPPGQAPIARASDFRFPVARGIELTTHERMETATPSAHGWPVLDLLPRLEAIVSRGDRAAEPDRRIAQAIPALRSLPALGPGEPLTKPVKAMMEKLTGRDLSQVRVYSSPVADALSAEAFTSGQRIVFAPGRMDLRSSRGLALLGHELAHLGRTLALKSNEVGSLSDAEERVALEQESAIQRVLDSADITLPRMDLLRVVSGARPAERSESVESNAPISGSLDTSLLTPADFATPEPVPASQPAPGTVHVANRQTAAAPVAVPSSPNATLPATQPDVDALARKVYDLLKDRLRSERERHELYSR